MKRLLVFCDGTGQDGLIVKDAPIQDINEIPGVSIEETSGFDKGALKALQIVASQPQLYERSEPDVKGGTLSTVSNILRLSRAVKQTSNDGMIRQIVYYQSGVGTEADYTGNIDIQTGLAQAYGVIVASKIRNAYAFLAQNYEKDDEILLFGFSRGAYTARKIAGLIDKIGLLQSEELGIFFNIWKDLVDNRTVNPPSGTRFPRIKCVGVFDTVGSVDKQIDALEIKDNRLPPCVDTALHAVSLQENRAKFLPTLFDPTTQQGQTLVEVWFPGAHSDVGGSYERHELADISLFWMTGEILARSLFDFDEKFIDRSKQLSPDAWGTSQPHNAYYETAYYKRLAVGHKNRLESGQITNMIIFHESWKFSTKYAELQHNEYMVAQDTLPFGELKFAPMNEFETYRKNNWDQNSGDPLGSVKDHVGVLFPGAELGAPFVVPDITFANLSTLPPAPEGLGYYWLNDPDLLDNGDNTRVPIFLYGGYLYTVLADKANSMKMFIITYDIYMREVQHLVKSGARYIWKIEYDANTKKMTFTGQSRNSVTATLRELAVGP